MAKLLSLSRPLSKSFEVRGNMSMAGHRPGKDQLRQCSALQTTEYTRLQTKRHVAEDGSSVQKIQHGCFSILTQYKARNPKVCTSSIKHKTQACRIWIQRSMLKCCKPFSTHVHDRSLLHGHTPRGTVLAPAADQCLGVCLLVGYPFGTH